MTAPVAPRNPTQPLQDSIPKQHLSITDKKISRCKQLRLQAEERLKEVEGAPEQLKAAEPPKRQISKTLQTKLQRAGQKALQIYKGVKKGGIPMQERYRTEILDSEHRYGSQLVHFHTTWAGSTSTDDFDTWLKRIAAGERAAGLDDLESYYKIPLSEIDKLRYLDKDQRQAYEMQVDKEGLISTKKDGLLGNPKTEYLFVVSPDDKVYLASYDDKQSGWHHSSFLSGSPVKFAGRLTVEKGKIVKIDSWSGHYQPKYEKLVIVLTTLQTKGIAIEEVMVDRGGTMLKAIDFLAQQGKVARVAAAPKVAAQPAPAAAKAAARMQAQNQSG